MRIVFIGAGRLATQLARSLSECGAHHVVAVCSRTMASASLLAAKVGAVAFDSLSSLPCDADVYIIAVKDDALPPVAAQLSSLFASKSDSRDGWPFVFHTAGSVPLSVLGGLPRRGVLYPLQTFSKERRADFARIPLFIEASDEETLSVARALASSVCQRVIVMDSEQRRRLHLAAVFACNFTNHCYTLAADILEQGGLPFDVIVPLVEETTAKISTMHPRHAQTGPAVRYDRNVIDSQSRMLDNEPLTQEIYLLMSRSIHEHDLK